MDPKEPRHRGTAQPALVVEVEAPQFVELLVSRRRLERVGNGEHRLHDLDTDEMFVMQPRSDAWFAQGA